ncbi:MAG: hypothetical protein GXP35_09750 [Actinobacteria bacterium]|nr:hypothetical protein [Actinomycetota bacterium]
MRRLIVVFLTMTLVAAACSSDGDDAARPPGTDNPTTTQAGRTINLSEGISLIAALQPFDTCQAFLDHAQSNALDAVGPWGLGGGGYRLGFDTDLPVLESQMSDSASEPVDTATATTSAAQVFAGSDDASRDLAEAGTDFSGTNVQEIGIDEPDLVKTDGSRMLVLAQQQLHLIDVSGDSPRLVTSMAIPSNVWVQDMLLEGDTVLLLAGTNTYEVQPLAAARSSLSPGGSAVTTLIEVSVTDSSLTLGNRLHMDGSHLSARLIDGVARVVVQSGPVGFDWAYPDYGGSGLQADREQQDAEEAAEEANREIIMNSTIENWLPYYVLETAAGSTISEGTLVECDQAYYPAEFSGLNMLNVVTIDLNGGGLSTPNAAAVMADGQTVYASTDSLYVATTEWVDWWALEQAAQTGVAPDAPNVTTSIHKFDISDPTRSTYVASGEVDGTVLNQYSLSEHNGFLRIATTHESVWWGDQTTESSSSLYVLETVVTPDGPTLAVVGQVDDLGRGERIFAVRYLGDIATIVTFRQTDPLYTIDLSNPTAPVVVGELKINGYSAYLHPIGNDLLLGVGQDATDEGRILGTQVSLFDISDLANPTRIAKWTLPGGSSDTEWDARAFLWWPAEELVVIPVNTYGWNEVTGQEDSFFGAIGLRVSDGSITELGRISQAEQITVTECWGETGWSYERRAADGTILDSESYDEGDFVEGSDDVEPAVDAIAVDDSADLEVPSEVDAPPAPDQIEPAPPVVEPPGRECQTWVEADWQAQILRTVVVGDQIHAISERGVLTVDLSSLAELSSIRFSPAQQ